MIPADTGKPAAPDVDPVLGQFLCVGASLVAAGCTQVAQPAEAVQHLVEADRRSRIFERRNIARIERPSGKRKPAMMDLVGNIGISDAQIGRRHDQPIRRAAGKAHGAEPANHQLARNPVPAFT
jgi:hypothetical protein